MNATLAFEPLCAEAIHAALPPGTALQVQVLPEVDSTNAVLWRNASEHAPCALLAERQTAGRGRRGRPWISAPGDSLCLSLRWACALPLADQGPLPLVVGLACAEALRGYGPAVRVKWPNDLVCDDAKLGGILVEARGTATGSDVVVGVGLNLRLPAGLATSLDATAQRPTALGELLATLPVRNELAATVLARLLSRMEQFADAGWPSLQQDWDRVDALAGRRVQVHGASGTRVGAVLGLAADGALRVRFPEGEATLHSGEVSVRP